MFPPESKGENFERACWVALSGFFGGPRLNKLWEHFSSGVAAWEADADLLRRFGFQEATINNFLQWRTKINPDICLELLAEQKIRFVLKNDQDYPRVLRDLYDAPALIFYKGVLPSESCVGVVGTRRPSNYGKSVALILVREICEGGLGIISGLARGIDTVAHEAALESAQKTIAVIGSGLDKRSFYPAENWRLGENIVMDGGCLLSEYPPGTKPQQHHFPERNRIIAGLSKAILVVEAPAKSGALITAFQALEYGREVMAIPGPITEPNSQGTNHLLKLGAHVITGVVDIFNCLGLVPASKKTTPQLDTESLAILELFANGALTIEEAAQVSSASPAKILMVASELELKGFLRDTGGRRFVSMLSLAAK